MSSPTSPLSRFANEPGILHLPDGGLVLCEQQGDDIRLRDLHSGDNILFSGVFAQRLAEHLNDPADIPFPSLGPVAERHPWLAQLHRAVTPSASNILLGSGLGMLFIELTDQCNESCIHCYAESSPQRSARLSREEILRVLQQAHGLGNPAVQFTGGDPLIHPDLLFAVQSARELGYSSVEIYTNGLALNQPLLDRLLPYSPDFSFSVYAHDAAVHDAITQTPGSLSRTIKAMRRVQQAGLALRVGIILMQENRGMEDATFAFLQDELGLHASQMGLDMVRSTGRGEFMPDYQPDTSRLQQYRHRAGSDSVDSGSERGAQTDMPPSARSLPTRRGKLCIAANGDVFPCIFSRRARLGNIREQSLDDVLASLDRRPLPGALEQRWQQCRESLSCSDCQAIAYLLGNDRETGQIVIPIMQGESHAATRTS
ncbi:MAG: hypothetical protein COS82_04745 [Zetaproteobacteria bacterium CG06_land_8_20_14_3_00_59_53]|nr:MAG: hypothetical protein AUK36_08030 [Zetaproteobacteria bacterium CG2_30_59_37]PIU70808.1 MAG: hypothetical protein COS82_04745 [Zetaproteobacteria bacterium CG06_land_8_20_14_3_00_59_53]PIY45352.1 MAG: hypothetical protein COZ02_09930 [Zetaproteobacteria bacterium CG_4_10_14_0_8_um_filter_59_127]HCS13848.1 hypothetical protein [Zetaproteobacteria bacterium]